MPRRLLPGGVFILLLIVLGVAMYARAEGSPRPHLFWLVPLILGGKFVLSGRQAPPHEERDGATVGDQVVVIVPIYNEDPAMLSEMLVSLVRQTRAPYAVHVVDDGSTSDAATRVARDLQPEFAAIGVDYRVTRYSKNRGKREALAVGVAGAPSADIYVCIDSDTRLHPDAIRYITQPFADDQVMGATGLVLASNHSRNLMTRLVDLRYAAAFLFERAAYSSLGSVLCCCGSLAAYRGWVVRAYLQDFLNQRFLGRRATFGDDRRLTNYCLLEGKVVLERRAIAETAVPERFGHYIRQQVRWNKSFFRESLWSIQHMPLRRPAFYLSLFELSSWLLFSALIVIGLTRPAGEGAHLLGTYLLFVGIMGYARSVRYFDVTHRPASASEKTRVFLLAPLYSCLHLLMLVPLRFYSLATLSSNGWGTRRRVEVRAAAEGTEVLDARGVPDWVTVREAAFLAGVSVASINELLDQGRIDSVSLLGHHQEPGLVLVRTRDLEWAGLFEGDHEHDPEPLSLELLLEASNSTSDHYASLAASNPPTDPWPSVEQVEVTVGHAEPAPSGRDDPETSPEETLRLIARTRTRPGEALPDWSSVEGAPRTDTPALGSR